MSKKCINCQNELEDEDIFCQECGFENRSEKETNKCPKCGKEISKTDAFCQNCGEKLKPVIKDKKEKIENKICPNCNDIIEEGENFCQKCGYKLEINELKECPNCGNLLKEEDAFCQKCGTRIDIVMPLEHIEKKIKKKRCPNCNDKIEEGEIFCQKCGTRLDYYEKNEDKTHGILKQEVLDNKGKNRNFITIILIIILLLIVIFSFLIIINKNEANTDSKDPDIYENKEEKNIINIYYDTNAYEFTTKKTKKLIGSLKAEDTDIKIYDGYIFNDENGGIIVYKDNNKIKIFNSKEEKSKTLSLSANHGLYYLVNNDEKVIGIYYIDGLEKEIDKYGSEEIKAFSNSGFYNIETKKEMYKKQDYYDFKYVTSTKIKARSGKDYDEKIYLLDLTNEKVYLTRYANRGTGCGRTYKGIGDYFILEGETICLSKVIEDVTIYDKNLNVIERNIDNTKIKEYKNELYYSKNNIIYIYDTDGIKKYESKEFQLVLGIINNYFIIVDNNKIYISNVMQNIKVLLGDYNKEYEYLDYLSGYKNEQGKEEIYIVLQTTNGNCEGIEFHFDLNTKKVEKKEIENPGGFYAKPMLYLYPEKETKVTIRFKNKDNLTTTYPKYENKWQVKAYPNGDLYDKDGKYYYGLYWEEKKNHNISFDTGFYVEKENAIAFLEEKLSLIGLNDKEKNEFIVYWLPILEKNEKSIVYFELTEERNTNSELVITPEPDSLLRVAMHVKKANEKTNIKEQEIEPFQRTGFTVVEWGGVIE